MSSDLTSTARGIGFTGALPAGATDIQKDGAGHYKITVGNEVKIFNSDGTPATDNSPSASTQDTGSSGTTQRTGGSGTPAGQAQSQAGSAASLWSVSGGYNIDPAMMGMAAMNTDAILQFGSQVPYGLGGQLSQGALSQNIMDYMGAAAFNFDFSNYYAASTPQQQTVPGSSTTPGSSPAPNGVPSGSSVVTDDSGVSSTVDDLAEDEGYKQTSTSGIYRKGDKYYKYDTESQKFVEASESEAKSAKKARAKELKQQKKDDAKIARDSSSICSNVFSSISGWGTNEDKLKENVMKINKDNVIKVFEKWDSDGYESKFGNEGGLIASIQDDVSGDFQDELEDHIADALCERAEELDLDDEAAEFKSKIDAARTRRGSAKDNEVNQAFKELVNLIKEKEAELEK